jgi:hypothetical protein
MFPSFSLHTKAMNAFIFSHVRAISSTQLKTIELSKLKKYIYIYQNAIHYEITSSRLLLR